MNKTIIRQLAGATAGSLIVAALIIAPRLLFSQGNIVPTTAPNVPVMKTLQQIEPRTDLKVLYDQNHDGIGDDANYEIVISQPGSYYLSSNMGTAGAPMLVTRTSAIHVTAAGVLDYRRCRDTGLRRVAAAGMKRAAGRKIPRIGYVAGDDL